MNQAHRSDPKTLGRRTLQRDHRQLSTLLRPGLSVLDVGCGTGPITAGIATAVGPAGSVLGIDRDQVLLDLARREHSGSPNLCFELGDATDLTYRSQFDIVTAARTLQWISQPSRAIWNLRRAAKPYGILVVLDYNHTKNLWEPGPPAEFNRFYRAFLDWRQSNGWDNQMADLLPGMFRSAGLAEVASHVQDEVTDRADPDFEERAALWSEVIDTLGPALVNAGYLTQPEVLSTRESYASWCNTALLRQTLSMRTVTGIVKDQPEADPFTGIWRLHPGQSKLATPTPPSWIQEIRATVDEVTVRERIVTAEGSQMNVSLCAKFDGLEYPVEGSPFVDTIAYTRQDGSTIFGTGRKEGAISMNETLTVDAEAGRLTSKYSLHAAGRVFATSVAVFEKEP